MVVMTDLSKLPVVVVVVVVVDNAWKLEKK